MSDKYGPDNPKAEKQMDAYCTMIEEQLAQAKAELAALRAECERLREDAERYRWLRDQAGEDGRAMVSVLKPGCNWWDDDMGVSKGPLDTAIDAAMKDQP